MAWIRTVPHEEASGLLRKIYDDAVQRAGKIFNILRVMSLSPRSLRASMELYMASMFSPSALSRAQREMLATVVSHANRCHY